MSVNISNIPRVTIVEATPQNGVWTLKADGFPAKSFKRVGWGDPREIAARLAVEYMSTVAPSSPQRLIGVSPLGFGRFYVVMGELS